MVASAAMAGVPLLNGFLSKEMFFAETVFVAGDPWVEAGLPIAATLAGMFAVVYSLRFGHDVFFGAPPRDLPREPHEPVFWMRLPIELLVLACLLVGIFPEWSVGPVLSAAALPVVGGVLPAFSLAVWHGFTAPFAMSLRRARRAASSSTCVFADALQAAAAARCAADPLPRRQAPVRARARRLHRPRAQAAPRRLDAPSPAAAAVDGRSSPVRAALASALVVPLEWGDRPRVPVRAGFVLLWLVGGAAAIGAAWQAKFHRLAALTMLGVVGLMVCLTFAWFSAPDLALTQIVVEVVTTVLFLLGLRWLPKRVELDDPRTRGRARWRRGRDVVIAVLAGTGIAALAYAMLTRSAPQSIAPFFLERAVPEGGGTNVVNVMLVDFRAFDTLGEITVLAVVGMTVYALLRRFRPPREAVAPPQQQRVLPPEAPSDLARPADATETTHAYLEVPAVLVRLLLPIAALVSLHLFLRGHNEPGGGFVAGLVMAIAFIAQYIVAGTQWVEDRTNLRPARWMAVGLALAIVTGLGALAVGYPFMTTHAGHFSVPVLGDDAPAERDLLRPRRVRGRRRRDAAPPDGARPPVAAREARAAAGCGGRRSGLMEVVVSLAIGVLGGCRRLAGAAPAHLPGADRARAAVVRGEPLHLQRRQPRDRQAADRRRPASRPTCCTTPTRCRRRSCSRRSSSASRRRRCSSSCCSRCAA